MNAAGKDAGADPFPNPPRRLSRQAASLFYSPMSLRTTLPMFQT